MPPGEAEAPPLKVALVSSLIVPGDTLNAADGVSETVPEVPAVSTSPPFVVTSAW